MKGLDKIPSTQELQVAYNALQDSSVLPSISSLVLWVQWSRFDPRLAEQCVTFFKKNWDKINPIEFNVLNRSSPWPAVLGVVLLQVELFSDFELNQKKLLKKWVQCVMSEVDKSENEQFFIGTRAFAGSLMFKDALLTIKPFRDWGFLGKEIFINKSRFVDKKSQTLIAAESRRYILNALLQKYSRITVEQYRAELENLISQRQAERDLQQHPRLKKIGQTRSTLYCCK